MSAQLKAVPTPDGKQRPDSSAPTEELEAYLKGLTQKFETGARPGKYARYRVWAENEFFWSGQQLLTYNYAYGRFEPWDEDDQDLYFIDNVFLPFVEQNATEYAKSKPKLVVWSRRGDDRKVAAAVTQAQYMADCLQQELWSAEDVQREAHMAQFRGLVFTRTWFDPDDATEMKDEPIMEPQQVPVGPPTGECAACGSLSPLGSLSLQGGQEPMPQSGGPASGETGASPGPSQAGQAQGTGSPSAQLSNLPCPQCGTPGLMVHPPPIAQTHAVTGTRQVPAGRIRSDAIDPFQVEIYDRAYNIRSSPYLRWEAIELKSAVKAEYPGITISMNDSTDYGGVYGQTGLAFLRQLEVRIGNSGAADAHTGYQSAYGYGFGSGAQLVDDLTCRHSRIYLDKVLYSEYVTSRPEKIPGTDMTVPPGTKLIDVFDKGLKLCMVNGQIVAAYNLDKNDEWDCYKYMVPAAGFYGVGIENGLPLQKWHNEAVSLDISDAMYASAGLLLADTSRIRDGQFTNKPGTVVPIEDKLPGETLEDIVKAVEFPGAGEKLANMRESLKTDMQFVLGARSTEVSGIPGPSIKTATGQQIQQSVSDSFAGTKTELKAENTARRVEQAIKLIQTYQLVPRYYQRYGDTKGKWLSAMDIPGDLHVRAEADSHSPRTQFDIKQDSTQAIALGWGAPETPPEKSNVLTRIFHMPEGQDDYDAWAIKGQLRLDQMQAADQMMAERGIPPQAAIQFVVQQGAPQQMDLHPMLLRFYEDVYLGDEWENFSPSLKQAIAMVVQAHQQAQGQPPPEDTPSESIAFKDMPIDGQIQMAAQAGIHLDPQVLMAKAAQDRQDQQDQNKAKLSQLNKGKE